MKGSVYEERMRVHESIDRERENINEEKGESIQTKREREITSK